jgi:hypothetical protein
MKQNFLLSPSVIPTNKIDSLSDVSSPSCDDSTEDI